MRKEFMKAAKSVGTFLTAGVLALGVTFSAQAQNELPLPAFPASFPQSTYQGQAGCVVDDFRSVFAIAENEGLDYIGAHPQVQTAKDGIFGMSVVYSKDKGYGYILENRGQGKRCVNAIIRNLKTHEELNLMQPRPVHHQDALKPEDCTFAPQVLNLCGTFEQISARLSAAGYSTDWQFNNEDGNAVTMMSGTGQSWMLTTHKYTGATIFTGAGKGEFLFPEGASKVTPPHLVVKN